ncbi:TetR/AcrR family transcriptional regulator [Rhodococcus sp. 06-418-5]|uniref:TetR/AcrR family transcriptional regulator n=1 Tax=Rhodococcus sp. 06-418-5 TaxID=2022507 RepID=UPI0015C64F1D|nr:TetR/AcrR family transcriptional regulator [Rhodococcus sp. 06-418-5]
MVEEATRRGPGRPRKDQPDPQRFQEILDGAATVFLARGYDASSIQEVADEVGMLKGSLYHYVKTKEDFLYEIIKRAFDAALIEVGNAVDLDGNALDRLTAFVRAHVEFTVANFTSMSIQFRERRALSENRRREITELGDAYTGLLRSILAEGRAEKLISDSLDVSLATWTILGQLNSLVNWFHVGGRMSVEELVQRLTGMILASVVSDEGVKRAGSLEAVRTSGPAALRATR